MKSVGKHVFDLSFSSYLCNTFGPSKAFHDGIKIEVCAEGAEFSGYFRFHSLIILYS